MLVPGMQRVTPLEEITVSDEWNGVSVAQEGFEEPVWLPATHSRNLTRLRVGRGGIPVRLITLLCAAIALGLAACMSEEAPTEPHGGPSLARAGASAYTPLDIGTLGGAFSRATGINPAGQVVGASATPGGEAHAFLWEKGVMTDWAHWAGPSAGRQVSTQPARWRDLARRGWGRGTPSYGQRA
jgi:probable HAF family extracellular repeat protein